MPPSQPLSLLQVLQKATDFLKKHHIKQARLHAEHLLAHLLEIPRLELYLQFDRVLTEEVLAPFRELLKKQSKGIPLQHLLGSVEFFGRNFLSDARALVPRPETEQLVERALLYFNPTSRFNNRSLKSPITLLEPVFKVAMADEGPGAAGAQQPSVYEILEGASTGTTPPIAATVDCGNRFLDVGTGSGVIAITLALENPEASIEAIDLSQEALALAQENASRHQASNITWHHGSLLEPLSQKNPRPLFDLIVANLPYIPSDEIPTLDREVQQDPMMALDGGNDGLELMVQLIEQAHEYLFPGGRLLLEIGNGQAEALLECFKKNNYGDIVALPDYQGVLRFVEAKHR
ncbi:MAG: peptide chain release factor N(5)-glutamine methyltransferase [Chthoniobacterales bacterium]|nr:peptide chain release factor N(5)-glutamine methyltransferase [Chthoniobacterales bacterium]